MKSFLSVERKEGCWVVCELENIPVTESTPDRYGEVECFYVNLPLSLFYDKQFPIKEGDIYVVEHHGNEVIEILDIDEDEKERRVNWLGNLA